MVAELWQRPANDTLTLEQWRYAASGAERAPRPVELHNELVDAGGVAAEWAWLEPSGGAVGGAGDGPVVLVFHGGGFVVCTAGSFRLLGARLAAAGGGRALVVDYRLAPEHPFPAAVEDCAAAYRWLLAEGVTAQRVVFFGDSAGGNLCLTTGLLARDEGLPAPAAMVLASPSPDLTYSGATYVTKSAVDPFSRIDNRPRTLGYYLNGADPTQPLASPLFADLSGFPPLLILVGPDEMHVDDCEMLAKQAAVYGVPATLEVVEGAFHTWLGYADTVPEAAASIARIGRFIRDQVPGFRPGN